MDSLTLRLWELGTSGLVEEPGGIRAFFEGACDRTLVCHELGVAESAVRAEVPFDEASAPRDGAEPLLIGDKFFVAPSWINVPTPAGRIRLAIDITSAFGTGRHETTQLCLEALERHLTPGVSVADIGCGTGILSLAAAKLGAGAVVSCDIHENSVSAARSVLETPLFVGSADGLRRATFDLVIANLTEKVLDVVAFDLKRMTKPDGLVIVSGFLESDPPKKYAARQKAAKDEWECWLCRPQDISAEPDAGEPAAHRQQWWL